VSVRIPSGTLSTEEIEENVLEKIKDDLKEVGL